MKEFEYIVLGLGGIGSGAVYWLARRAGRSVLGLEQFAFGHDRGGSHDHSRIIRRSYHTPYYVEMAKQAYDAWETLEADAGESLILRTGGLDLSPPDAGIDIEHYKNSLRNSGVEFEWLDAKEAMYRWPQWRLPDGTGVIYQPDGGIAPAEKCVAAHLRMARSFGATLRENAPVTRIQPAGDQLEVEAGGELYRCRQLIIAAGAWTNHHLAHFGRNLPLKVTKEQVTYFQTPQVADFAPERFPIWIWMDQPSFYGFPVYGEAGPKVAQDSGGKPVDPDTRGFETDPDISGRVYSFVNDYLPTIGTREIYTKTCLYTLTPDREFVLSKLPEQPNVQVAVGAGHAFKFSSVLGKYLAELALDGRSAFDLSLFDIDRPILLEENPAPTRVYWVQN